MRRPGVCVPFADPAGNGLEADLFWRPESFGRLIKAHVRYASDPVFGSVIALGNFSADRTLLKTADGDQHLLLKGPRHSLQVLCRGVDIRVDPFAIELVVDRFPRIETRVELLREMAKLYGKKRIGGGTGGWTTEAQRHRDALIAYDLREMLGWKFQRIARFIHGNELVDREWTNPNRTLKNKTQLSYRRAIRMISGGYRSLLL